MVEEWKPAAGFPDYEVSSFGRVRRLTTRTSTTAGRILKPALHYRGYLQHGLALERKTKTVRLNRLICATFHGPAPSPQHEAAHEDGNPLNNCAANLRWSTKIENEQDKNSHGTRRRGMRVSWAKLTDARVREIRRSQESATALAKRFGVSDTLIRFVRRGRNWTHVS